jgi:hypothetical protein
VFSPRSAKLRSLHPDESQYAPGTMNSFRDESGGCIIKRRIHTSYSCDIYTRRTDVRHLVAQRDITRARGTHAERHRSRPVRFQWNAQFRTPFPSTRPLVDRPSKECVGQDSRARPRDQSHRRPIASLFSNKSPQLRLEIGSPLPTRSGTPQIFEHPRFHIFPG